MPTSPRRQALSASHLSLYVLQCSTSADFWELRDETIKWDREVYDGLYSLAKNCTEYRKNDRPLMAEVGMVSSFIKNAFTSHRECEHRYLILLYFIVTFCIILSHCIVRYYFISIDDTLLFCILL